MLNVDSSIPVALKQISSAVAVRAVLYREGSSIFFKFRFRKKVVRDPKKEAMVFFITIVGLILLFMIVLRYFVIKTSPLRVNADKSLADHSLYFSLNMEKTNYSQGEPIVLQLGMRNTGSEAIKLAFPTSLDCDFVVEREYDLFFVKVPYPIWKYSAQVGELQKPHDVTIKPGQVNIFKGQWNQNDFNGKPVKPGKYRITGVVNTKNFKLTLVLRSETE